MNPLTFLSTATAVWLMIPKEKREQYANDLLDLVEDLVTDARDAMANDETEEVKNEDQ